ncbi:hypothetical protein N9Y00_06960 [Tateyamaria sp.]|nr:hypothetical protein [Tateyamaria sp.]
METFENARREAEARWAAGWRPKSLLGSDNVKLQKASKKNWRGLGLSLAPADVSGFEVCASRSPECTKHCIFTSGRGAPHFTRKDGSNPIWMGRIFRTLWWFRARDEFKAQLHKEISRNQDAAIRLNVYSDIMWERQFPEIATDFPNTQFYDYTKHFNRMFRDRPDNYHLTFSLHENNQSQAKKVLQAGMNVAAITDEIGGSLFGFPVIDGDDHDLRFLDPTPCVVGLRAKGSLKTDLNKEMVYETTRETMELVPEAA